MDWKLLLGGSLLAGIFLFIGGVYGTITYLANFGKKTRQTNQNRQLPQFHSMEEIQ